MKYLRSVSILLLVLSCTRTPSLKEINSNSIDKNSFIDTSIIDENKVLLSINPPVPWTNRYYCVKYNEKIFLIDPGLKRGYGTYDLKIIKNKIYFYSENRERGFGAFWMIKEGDKIDFKYDLIKNDSLNHWSVKYKNGKLIEIGHNELIIDSAYIKSKLNKIYKVVNSNLIEYSDYSKYSMKEFEDGIYYFAYPGRKIDKIIDLEKIN